MNKKLFYEQPQIGVLHLNTEGLMVGFSNREVEQTDVPGWDEGDE